MTSEGANRERTLPAWPVFAAATACAVVVALLAIALALTKPLDHDEHQFVASGALLARSGALPYRDYPYFHVPVLTLVYGALFAASPYLLLTARLFCAACALGCALLLFLLGARALGARGAWAAAAAGTAAVAVYAGNPLFVYTAGRAWNHDLPVVATLAAFVCCHRAIAAGAGGGLVVATGVLAAIAAGTRASYVLTAAVFPVALAAAPGPARARLGRCAAFAAGFTLGIAPVLAFLALAPDAFLHGNLRYNTSLNPEYRRVLGWAASMTLGDKLAYVADEVLQLKANAALVAAAAVCSLGALAGARDVSTRAALGMLWGLAAAAFVGGLAPTPSWYQYFYPPVPFLIAATLFALARFEAMRLRPVAVLALAALAVTTVDAYARYAEPITEAAQGRLTAVAIHDAGRDLRDVAPEGKVLTLAPVVPLEGGLEIYRGLATGPFSWRTARFVPADERAALHVLGPEDVGHIFEADAPAAVLLGYENDPQERLEEPIRRAAELHGYVAVPFRAPSELLVRRDAAPSGAFAAARDDDDAPAAAGAAR